MLLKLQRKCAGDCCRCFGRHIKLVGVMMTEVFAPASCGNFAVGFDLLGAAIAPINGKLGDVVAIDKSDTGQDA